MVTLRDYQSKAGDAAIEQWREASSTLIVMPTGTGKTVVFADIARRRFPARTMILAHRQELVFQARDKIRDFTGMSCEIEMGDYKASGDDTLFTRRAPCVVSTVQTHTAGGDGGGRMGKFNPMHFGTLIIDEAHHATSASYRRTIDYYRTNPKLKVLGVTATPDRSDEEALGQVFETVAFDYEILDAINDGWLVPIQQQMVRVEGLDFSAVRTTAGDLNGADLAEIMEAEKALHGVTGPAIEIIADRRAIVFTASVLHARQTAEIFNRHRAGMAAWVCGATDTDERARILAEFKRGKIQVVCNCNVLTEGFDDPGVEVVIMARPTKSRSLYAQMIGRSTRPLPGIVDGKRHLMDRRLAISLSAKPNCLVVDCVGNSGKHKLMTTADILGGNVSDEAIESVIFRARSTGKPVQMDRELLEEEELQREKKRLEAEARRAKLVAKAKYKTQTVDPFDLLQITPVKERGWDKNKRFSEGQAAMLRRNGVDPGEIEYAQGKQLLNAIGERIQKKLCSLGQMKMLKKYYIDPAEITFEHASRMIDAIAKNGWRKPTTLPQPLAHAQGIQNDGGDETVQANLPEEDNVPF